MKNFIILILVLCSSITLSAHSGRTDGQGGHHDRKNGGYHFHHGYGPHHHTGGVCPLSSNDNDDSSDFSLSPLLLIGGCALALLRIEY